MAARALRPCLESARGCRELVAGGGRCPEHAKERDRIEWTEHGSSSSRGYGQAWKGLRAAVLLDEPLCRHCAAAGRVTAASDVDHVIPKALGGTDDRSNLSPLCADCHARKTIRDHRAIAARKADS